jgi:hypothetical protein
MRPNGRAKAGFLFGLTTPKGPVGMPMAKSRDLSKNLFLRIITKEQKGLFIFLGCTDFRFVQIENQSFATSASLRETHLREHS